MASKSIGWACAVILLGSTVVNAQVDLSQMLGSLNFAGEDPPAIAGEESAAAAPAVDRSSKDASVAPAQDENATRSQPPESPAMPDLAPQSVLEDEGPIGGSGLDDYWQAPVEVQSSPSAVPVPPADSSAVGQRVDFDAVFAESAPAVPAHSAPAHSAGAACESIPPATVHHRDAWVQQYPGYPSGGPVSVHKVPHATPCLEFPNLPPPSSAEAYYRTPACYRNLWGGYGEEKAHHCQKWHRHLHGHCGCTGPGDGQCIGSQVPCGCPTCGPRAATSGEVPCAAAPSASRHR